MLRYRFGFLKHLAISQSDQQGCGFIALSWKRPAYSGAFYLQLTILAFLLTIGAFFAYSGKVRLIRALRDLKQRSSTVSKRAPIVSKKASPDQQAVDCKLKRKLSFDNTSRTNTCNLYFLELMSLL